MDTAFPELHDELTADVDTLQWRDYVIVEVDAGLPCNPYAQVAREPDGTWYCEVVADHYLPSDVWPIDEFFLVADGWTPPVDPRDNWSCTVDSAARAATTLIDALRHARACPDPYEYTWTQGRFPPDDDGRGDREPVVPPGPYGLAA